MRARILRPTPRNLARCAAALRRGEPVAVPTETVYGLAADALDARACARIFRAKGRPASDPLIVHVSSVRAAAAVAELNPAARRLAASFWPGPLTLVLPKKSVVPALVTAGLPSVAVRVPAHPVMRALLRASGRPLAAPSANPFGYISPTTAAHVRDGLGGKIRLILDGGPCRVGLESTIVDLRDPRRPRVLRPGAITAAQLARALGRAVAGPVGVRAGTGKGKQKSPAAAQLAPGLLARHYSPRTPLRLVKKISARAVAVETAAGAGTAWLFFARPKSAALRGAHIRWLTERGAAADAARALFAALRALDRGGFRAIVAELPPPSPLAPALADRLHRAAARG